MLRFIRLYLLLILSSSTVLSLYENPISVLAQPKNDSSPLDTSPPRLMVPKDSVIEAASAAGTIITYKVIVTDNVDSSLIPLCSPASGSTFPIGSTKVVCKSVDKSGNIGQETFNVMVRDTTPPETKIERARVGILGEISSGMNTSSDKISLELSGSDNVGIDRFECKLDGHGWIPSGDRTTGNEDMCTYTDISSGSHKILVRAIDNSGNMDTIPTIFNWHVLTINESVSALIREVEELPISPSFRNNMLSPLTKIFDGLSADNTVKDTGVCDNIESYLKAIKDVTLKENFHEKIHFIDLILTLRERIGCPPPIANAGKDISGDAGSIIQLDGSGSKGLYADDVTYVWKQTSGPSAKLSTSHSSKPEFTAPDVAKNVNLKFDLTVTDARGLSSTDSVTVKVNQVTSSTSSGSGGSGEGNVQEGDYNKKGLNIAAVGDWGCNSNTQSNRNNIAKINPELVLALGDYSYSSTATCWLNIIDPIASITRIAIGNHEDQTSEDSNSYLSHFGLSKPYYSFDYQDIHILTMNSEQNYAQGSSQYNFVKNDLQLASSNPHIRWIIVTFHEPAYTSPNSCSSCKAATSIRDIYHPIFDQYRVDLVLEGHVHNYQRSYPLAYNENNPSKPLITAYNKNNYIDPKGSIFAVVGTGGINLHSLAGKEPFIVNQQDSKFGFLNIYFSDDGKAMDAQFIANDGSVLDQFSITKSSIPKVVETPKVLDASVTLLQNSSKDINLNSSGTEGENIKFSLVTDPKKGILNGKVPHLTYKPNKDFVGQDSFTFKATDDKGSESNIATVTIDVKAANQAPVSEDQSVSVDKNKLLDITLVAKDGEGNPIQFALEAQPANGDLSNFDASQGTATYKPNKDFVGQDSFTFKATDDKGSESNIATVTIDVKAANQVIDQAVNKAPVSDPGKDQQVDEGTNVILDGSNSTDAGNKSLIYKWEQLSGPPITIPDTNKDRIQFFAPQVNHETDMIFKLTVTDQNGAHNSKKIHITVNDLNSNSGIVNKPIINDKSTISEQALSPSMLTPLQNPSGEPNTFHPNLLKAVLIQNGTGLQHEMMLKSYSKAGEEIDTHRTYPKRIALTLQNGLPLTIASSDSGISLLPTGLTLYDENNLPVYLMRQDGTSWAIDVPEGIYNVEVKAEYTPSGETATFVDKIRIKDTAPSLAELIHKNLIKPNLEKLLQDK